MVVYTDCKPKFRVARTPGNPPKYALTPVGRLFLLK